MKSESGVWRSTIAFTAICAGFCTAAMFASDSKPIAISALVGDWSGTSICRVHPSACHDESVVLRFSRPHENKINIEASKIVNGKAEFMGAGEWSYDPDSHSLTWQMPRGTWNLSVTGNEMDGTLIVPENVIFRKIHLHKSK